MEAAIERCDKLHNTGHMVEALGTIIEFKDDPNSEVQWRLGRAIYKEAEYKGAGPKHKGIAESLEVLGKALEAKPDCWKTHLWYAIVLGSKDKHESFKQQIEEAFIIREHVDKCLELNPQSDLAYHVLGEWCYQVASVSWLQKKTAATLFAKPPEATLEESLSAFKKSEELLPGVSNYNHLYIAKVLIDMGKKTEAQEHVKQALVIPEEKKNDRDCIENAEEAKKLAKKCGLKL